MHWRQAPGDSRVVCFELPSQVKRMRRVHIIAAIASLAVGACTTAPSGVAEAELDRFEEANRAIYKLNRGFDKAVLRPTTMGYRAVVPAAARRGASNALDNVDEPLTFINALLQGKIKSAFRAVDRFAVNSTLGVGGLADHATDMGLPRQEEDFGQTLAAWGIGSGPFLMLPFFGPSTLRDVVGLGVDTVTDPWPRFQKRGIDLTGTQRMGMTGLEVIDLRSRLVDTADPLLEGALDEYATVRSAYLQQRLSAIYDGDPPEDNFAPTFEEDTVAAPPPVAGE